MNDKRGNGGIIFPLIVVACIAFMSIFMLNHSNNLENDSKYYQIIDYYEKDEISESTLEYSNGISGNLEYTLKADTSKKYVYKVPDVRRFVDTVNKIMLEQHKDNLKESSNVINYVSGSDYSWMISLLPTFLIMFMLIGLSVFMFKFSGAGAGKIGQFGKNNFRHVVEKGRTTTFDQVAGADEEKEELAEIVEFLKNPKKFSDIGARVPKGVLLIGPPGTGKTLLARAVAGEANVPFFSISGSDFVEMYVGVGASRVRDLFDQAKKNSPAIIFIDEIDAVGRQRGAGLGGGHDEREQTLNQLLVEMDGFGANTGIIIIAATNRRDILDPALLRSGRFDRQVIVGYPDVKGREGILKVHSKDKPLGFDVDLSVVAKSTVGFTGADLESLMNEAALLAAKKSHKAITSADIQEATMKVIAGPEKKSRVIYEDEKRLTAYHEAGHAVATYFCPTQDPVHEISIIPRGMAGGYTMSLPERDKSYILKTKMEESLIVLLGGRVAESIVLGDISTGASNDIERATDTARNMVTKYGFTEDMGPIVYGTGEHEVFLGRDFNNNKNYSETTATEIDKEIRKIIDTAYSKCHNILTKNINYVHVVAQYLIKAETISGDDFKKIMTDEITMEYVKNIDKPNDDNKEDLDSSDEC